MMTANEIKELTFEQFITDYNFEPFLTETQYIFSAMKAIKDKKDLSYYDDETIKIAKKQIKREKKNEN